MKRIFALILAIALVFGLATAFAAQTTAITEPDKTAVFESASNRFLFGDTLFDDAGSQGDLVAAGKSVSLGGVASGDVIAFGSKIDLATAQQGGNLFVAGSQIQLNNVYSRNLYAAGAAIAASGEWTNGAYLLGSQVAFSGKTGDLNIAAKQAAVSGIVEGNAVIRAKEITIAQGTQFGGTLTIYAPEQVMLPASVDPSQVHFIQTEASETGRAHQPLPIGRWILSVLSAAVLALLITLLGGKQIKARSDEMGKKVGWAILFGLITFIVTPIVAILLCITVVGAVVALPLILVYVIGLVLAVAFTGAVLGRLVFPRMNRYLSAMIGAAVLRLLLIVPVLGAIIYFACAFYALGAFIMNLRLNEKEKTEEETVLPAQPPIA